MFYLDALINPHGVVNNPHGKQTKKNTKTNKNPLALWKSYDKSGKQHIKNQRYHFAKVHIVKAMVFPVAMYGCESWTINKAEHRRTDAFELWCWIRLESPLDSKEIKSVNPKGNQP